MNINFGLLEPLVGRVPKKKRKEEYVKRAIRDITAWQAKWLPGSKCSV
jgi:folate-dependent tRNA-U54 methylase TrmFO/GidA